MATAWEKKEEKIYGVNFTFDIETTRPCVNRVERKSLVKTHEIFANFILSAYLSRVLLHN